MYAPRKSRTSTLQKHDANFAALNKAEQQDVLSILYRFLFGGHAQGSGKIRALRGKKRDK